ncbi:UDP-glucose 4-epimerase GalE [Pannus brasiliensis CCIBt3594]|uniref:UDP-glucose 4-epimerase n=1 Tax=Pannus brasiliensis CCIBt3594 TaxID=1427578 RepID=A0AAW9QWW6_9CHRO
MGSNQEAILITGGAGYIGSHVVRQLGEAGYNTVVYDNCSTGNPASVLYGELVIGDLADLECLYRTFARYNFTAVLHFAASMVVPESIAYPLDYYANNTRNTLNLLRCCQAFGVNQFVFSSTAAVYGDTEEALVTERTLPRPINPYGRSKLASEWTIEDFGRAGDFRSVILRYFNVAGADPEMRIGQYSPRASHLIKMSCQAALGKRPSLSVFGTDFPTPDGTGVRDYIHVEDLAAAHVKALDYLRSGGESQILNCGYGRGYSVREVIATVREISGNDFPVVEEGRRPGDPACVIADSTRIRELLAWRPRFDNLETIVRTTLEWEKKLDTVIRRSTC